MFQTVRIQIYYDKPIYLGPFGFKVYSNIRYSFKSSLSGLRTNVSEGYCKNRIRSL